MHATDVLVGPVHLVDDNQLLDAIKVRLERSAK